MSEREKSDRPRFWTPEMIAVCAVLAVVVLLFLVWVVSGAIVSRAVERELAEIRAKGEPVSFEDIAPPFVPYDENAAPVFEQAFAEVKAGRSAEKSDPDLKKYGSVCQKRKWPFDPEVVGKALKYHRSSLEIARRALARPRCRFDVDYSQGADIETKHHGNLLELATLFRASALLRLHEGRLDEAIGDVDSILGVARAMAGDPILPCRDDWWDPVEMGLDVLKEAERTNGLSGAARRRFLAELSAFEFAGALRGIALSGRIAYIDAYDRLRTNRKNRLVDRDLIPVKQLSSLQARRETAWIRAASDAVVASALPPWEALPKMESVRDELTGLRGLTAPFRENVIDWVWKRSCVELVRVWAYRDAGILGLSCELRCSAHGDYPATLDALVPEFLSTFPDGLPPDPFTGKPFVYKKRPDGRGFIVYSVGENLKDDGGVEDEKSGKDDVSWERRPPGEQETDATDE